MQRLPGTQEACKKLRLILFVKAKINAPGKKMQVLS
jgi:hypothetical protein